MEAKSATLDSKVEMFNMTFGNIKTSIFPKLFPKLLNVNRVRLKRTRSELKVPLIFRKLEQRSSEPRLKISSSLVNLLQNQDRASKKKLSMPRVFYTKIVPKKEQSTERFVNSYPTERNHYKLQPISLPSVITKEEPKSDLGESHKLIRLFSKGFLLNSRYASNHNPGVNARFRCPIRPRLPPTLL
eukprot:TRINITY_DN7791_c0_g3_i1.p1 TRINITY_DN7791_c0_g3~~TRINITY_DN7791_c0_g3_i1.p1  ORF type:complete len:186 (-),score=15.35 TRINITY_DN7791_c0_g3_i1:118-675(-)